MKTLALLLSLTLPVSAVAQEDDESTFFGGGMSELDVGPVVGPLAPQDELDARQGIDAVSRHAATALDLPIDYVQGTRDGIELVYNREYKGAQAHFKELERRFPGTGIRPSIDALIYQAMMLENFDFRYAELYERSSARALKELGAALKTKGGKGWTHFLMAGMMGVEAIHTIRRQKYLGALSRAFEAMDHIALSKKHAPDFVDVALADGMYNYWRTVVTLSSKLLPDFGDHRALGLKQMATVEKKGFFLRAPATLSLTFAWLEERKFDEAIEACERNKRAYPDSVINNLILGQSYYFNKRYTPAMASYDDVLRVDGGNNRVHYYRGRVLQRQRKRDQARKVYYRYLASDHLERWQRAAAHYRIGQTLYSDKRFTEAAAEYQHATKAYDYKPAKRAYSGMKKARREGKIDF